MVTPEPFPAPAWCVLAVSGRLQQGAALARAAQALWRALRRHGVDIVLAETMAEAQAIFAAAPALQAVLLNGEAEDVSGPEPAMALLQAIRARNAGVPVFWVTARPGEAGPVAGAEYCALLEEPAGQIAARIVAAIRRYREHMLPPLFAALEAFTRAAEHSWHTPGHMGGAAFLRSPVGRIFHDYLGEPVFRADLSVSVGALGSLLDHSGPIGASELYAAHVFGADRTYYVTNGTSTSNRVVMNAAVARGQVVLVDRNCHKSVEHGLCLTGGVPVYLRPHRNHLGLIGPIPPAAFAAANVAQAIATTPLAAGCAEKPALAVVTNATYDGLCYNAARVEELLGESVDRVLFDEAWFGHARFHPLYAQRFAMRGAPSEHDRNGPTVFATQSTHKLLAALSQASMIHLREGRVSVPHAAFNQAYMMHASTSPQYAIIASNDVCAAMMEGASGRALTGEAIAEAVAFRQAMARLAAEFAGRAEWFFAVWQPEAVADGAAMLDFAAAPAALLAEEPGCWALAPGAAWHGFPGLEPGFCMLDPLKVTVITPGLGADGGLRDEGIPAPLLTAYLAEQGIIVEKTANFSILLLFSIGVTQGKWGPLVNALLAFKRDYDGNAPLARIMPKLVEKDAARYGALGLRELAAAMFAALRRSRSTELLQEAYNILPAAAMSPAAAHDQLVRAAAREVALAGLAGGVAAAALVPYPPGIPLVMPGEKFGPAAGPVLRYLAALQAFDAEFPAFAHDTHGLSAGAGGYRAMRF